MSLEIENLRLFVRAAALGAIGRAGQELGFSTTSASQKIKALEDALNVKLFHRSTRNIALTANGEVFLEHAKRILSTVEDAQEALSGDADPVAGTLRVAASASFARLHITPHVPEFLMQHPDLNLDLHLSDAIFDIVEQGYDLAFRIGDLAPSSLLARKIADNSMSLVATPAYLARHGVPQNVDDLANHVCLGLGRSAHWTLRAPDGTLHTVSTARKVTVNLGDAVATWVLAGMGIGLASLWHAGPDLRAGRLVPVLPDYRIEPETSIWAVRPPGSVMPRRVQTFLTFIEQRLATETAKLTGQSM